ncbi:hypothetical protein GIB67_040377 [Kingdonia uniflora]|uniref:ATPase AAA-type core domain-containing protein n=1 Tax=Kingdonia uniflora TaxID=39325 RepID=A0A7J7KXJ2_9MAGN|nr:hypothetical protein GIB67_040377 [Kingdonia uniflora]
MPAKFYSTITIAIVRSIRFTLSIGLYLWIDSMARPIYVKLIPCDLGIPPAKEKNPLKRSGLRSLGALGSLCKIREKFILAEEITGVTFNDFAGHEYIKRELEEIVRILKNEEEFQNKGIYCPKGVMLHGPPGTGKILLAKAIAGEASVPFLVGSGTDFVKSAIFVGYLITSNAHLIRESLRKVYFQRENNTKIFQFSNEIENFKQDTRTLGMYYARF